MRCCRLGRDRCFLLAALSFADGAGTGLSYLHSNPSNSIARFLPSDDSASFGSISFFSVSFSSGSTEREDVLSKRCKSRVRVREAVSSRTRPALPTDYLLERSADLLKLVWTESAFEELPMKDWEFKKKSGRRDSFRW